MTRRGHGSLRYASCVAEHLPLDLADTQSPSEDNLAVNAQVITWDVPRSNLLRSDFCAERTTSVPTNRLLQRYLPVTQGANSQKLS